MNEILFYCLLHSSELNGEWHTVLLASSLIWIKWRMRYWFTGFFRNIQLKSEHRKGRFNIKLSFIWSLTYFRRTLQMWKLQTKQQNKRQQEYIKPVARWNAYQMAPVLIKYIGESQTVNVNEKGETEKRISSID